MRRYLVVNSLIAFLSAIPRASDAIREYAGAASAGKSTKRRTFGKKSDDAEKFSEAVPLKQFAAKYHSFCSSHGYKVLDLHSDRERNTLQHFNLSVHVRVDVTTHAVRRLRWRSPKEKAESTSLLLGQNDGSMANDFLNIHCIASDFDSDTIPVLELEDRFSQYCTRRRIIGDQTGRLSQSNALTQYGGILDENFAVEYVNGLRVANATEIQAAVLGSKGMLSAGADAATALVNTAARTVKMATRDRSDLNSERASVAPAAEPWKLADDAHSKTVYASPRVAVDHEHEVEMTTMSPSPGTPTEKALLTSPSSNSSFANVGDPDRPKKKEKSKLHTHTQKFKKHAKFASAKIRTELAKVYKDLSPAEQIQQDRLHSALGIGLLIACQAADGDGATSVLAKLRSVKTSKGILSKSMATVSSWQATVGTNAMNLPSQAIAMPELLLHAFCRPGSFPYEFVIVFLHLVLLIIPPLPIFALSWYAVALKDELEIPETPHGITPALSHSEGGYIIDDFVGWTDGAHKLRRYRVAVSGFIAFVLGVGVLELVSFYRTAHFKPVRPRMMTVTIETRARRWLRKAHLGTLVVTTGSLFAYIIVVAVWFILGAILNPNKFLPYAAAAVTFVSTGLTRGRTLSNMYTSVQTKVMQIIQKHIKKLIEGASSNLKDRAESAENAAKEAASRMVKRSNAVRSIVGRLDLSPEEVVGLVRDSDLTPLARKLQLAGMHSGVVKAIFAVAMNDATDLEDAAKHISNTLGLEMPDMLGSLARIASIGRMKGLNTSMGRRIAAVQRFFRHAFPDTHTSMHPELVSTLMRLLHMDADVERTLLVLMARLGVPKSIRDVCQSSLDNSISHGTKPVSLSSLDELVNELMPRDLGKVVKGMLAITVADTERTREMSHLLKINDVVLTGIVSVYQSDYDGIRKVLDDIATLYSVPLEARKKAVNPDGDALGIMSKFGVDEVPRGLIQALHGISNSSNVNIRQIASLSGVDIDLAHAVMTLSKGNLAPLNIVLYHMGLSSCNALLKEVACLAVGQPPKGGYFSLLPTSFGLRKSIHRRVTAIILLFIDIDRMRDRQRNWEQAEKVINIDRVEETQKREDKWQHFLGSHEEEKSDGTETAPPTINRSKSSSAVQQNDRNHDERISLVTDEERRRAEDVLEKKRRDEPDAGFVLPAELNRIKRYLKLLFSPHRARKIEKLICSASRLMEKEAQIVDRAILAELVGGDDWAMLHHELRPYQVTQQIHNLNKSTAVVNMAAQQRMAVRALIAVGSGRAQAAHVSRLSTCIGVAPSALSMLLDVLSGDPHRIFLARPKALVLSDVMHAIAYLQDKEMMCGRVETSRANVASRRLQQISTDIAEIKKRHLGTSSDTAIEELNRKKKEEDFVVAAAKADSESHQRTRDILIKLHAFAQQSPYASSGTFEHAC